MRFMSTLATSPTCWTPRPEFGSESAHLAAAHAGVGVRAAHFAPMGVALMVTLAETLGEDYSPDLQAAWHAAYDHFAALMIARGGFE